MKRLLAPLMVLFASQAFAISIHVQVYNATCIGSNGAVLSTVSGGVAPYTYVWSNGGTTAMITGLTAGPYSLTVTDNLGATANISCMVSQVNAPSGLDQLLGFAGLEACGQVPDGGFRLHLLRIPGMYTFTTVPPLTYTELPEDEDPAFDYYATYEFLGASQGFPVQLTVTNGCGSSSIPVTVQSIQFPSVNIQSITGSCNSADDGSLSGTVTLAPNGFDPNNWSMVATDFPITGNQVTPTPSFFSTGTSSFNLYGLHPGTTWDLYLTSVEFDGSQQQPCAYAQPFFIDDLGTDCGTVSGTVHFEVDADCLQDGVEPGVPYQVLRVTPGPFYGITDAEGQYDIALPFGTFAMEQMNPDVVQLCPPGGTIPFTASSGPGITIDIADSLGTPTDIRLAMGHPLSRVGLPFDYRFRVRNMGAHTADDVVVTLDHSTIFSFTGATPSAASASAGQVQWSVAQLLPFQEIEFWAHMQVPPDPLLLGTTVEATATATTTTFEPYTLNNTQTIWHEIRASSDPNDKQAYTSSGQNEAVYLLDVDEHIDYEIRFQNTGTDTAFNIVVTDTISDLLDLASLEILGASHAFTPHIATGRVLEFRFNDILLPDSTTDELASHGYIAYRMRPVPGIALGAVIDNAADIFFDFNDPVRTNTASLTVGITTAVDEQRSATLMLAPVPAEDVLRVSVGQGNIVGLSILGTDGRLVRRAGAATTIDVSTLAPGAYLLKARLASGEERVARFVKR